MTNTITKNILGIITGLALAFSFAFTAFAYDELDIRATIEDGVANVTVSYEEDNAEVVQEYEYEIDSIDDLIDTLADELDTSEDVVEDALSYKTDDSTDKGQTREKIDDAQDLLSAASEAIDDAVEIAVNNDDINAANRLFNTAEDTLEDAEEQYVSEDYELARQFVNEAEDELLELFDILDADPDDYVDMTDAERREVAEEVIEEAEEKYDDARRSINRADDEADVRGAVVVADEAEELYEAAQEELLDENYIIAKRLANKSIEKSESVRDILAGKVNEDAELDDESNDESEDNEDVDKTAEFTPERRAELQAKIFSLLQLLVALLTRSGL